MSIAVSPDIAEVTHDTLPPPLVKIYRHPFRWTKQKFGLTIAALIGAHIGTLVIVALYYIVLETYHPITVVWHEVASSNYWRHLLRGVGEGLLGGTLGQMLVWNAYTKKSRSAPHLLDKIEMKLRIPNIKDPRRVNIWQLLAFPFLVILYGAPGFGLAALFVRIIHHSGTNAATLITTASHGHIHAASYWSHVKTIWTGEWDKKIIGIFASLCLGRRPVRKISNDVQLWFAERRVILKKPLRFYHPPTFKARYNYLMVNGTGHSTVSHKGIQATLMVWSTVVMLGLAGFGYYVLTVIAKAK